MAVKEYVGLVSRTIPNVGVIEPGKSIALDEGLGEQLRNQNFVAPATHEQTERAEGHTMVEHTRPRTRARQQED